MSTKLWRLIQNITIGMRAKFGKDRLISFKVIGKKVKDTLAYGVTVARD